MTASAPTADQVDDGLVECRICHRRWRSLGHHLRRAHDMSADDYRDQYGIRRGQPLTSPACRKRWQEKIADQIATGSLAAHYAGNAERAAAAREESLRVLQEQRARGMTRRPSVPPRPREYFEAIVAMIEAGTARSDALAAASISEGRFYSNLDRHPDLKSRMAKVAEKKVAQTAANSGRPRQTEMGSIIATVERMYPKASLLYARIVIALLNAPGRSLSVSDLSDALGKGRDSSAVQSAVARMDALGVVRRELRSAEQGGARAWTVSLIRMAGRRR